MTGRDTHELIERYRLHNEARLRQGFCAALPTTRRQAVSILALRERMAQHPEC